MRLSRFLAIFVLLLPISLYAQVNPGIVPYLFNGTASVPVSNTSTAGQAVNFPPPGYAMYGYNTGSSAWFPCTTSGSCFGGSGGGGGTVTNFTFPTTLGALFACTTTNPTTTPTVACAVSSAAQNTFYAGPASGGTGPSSFRFLAAADIAIAGTLTNSISGQAATVATISGLVTNGSNITITGSGTLGSPYAIAGTAGTVTSFAAPSASWPTWLVPTVTNGPTTPSLTVAASPIPNAALANSSINVNGTTCTLGAGCAPASGVTTTGSPASGNLTEFSGSGSVTNGNLSGDVATSGTLATTLTATTNGTLVTLTALSLPLSQTTGTLPTGQTAALTGDVTKAVGSNATTVVQVNGAAIPASASILSSNSSSQIVAASTTGTGNAVLATSPTLVTPVLGTATATLLTSTNVSISSIGTGFCLKTTTGGSVISAGSACYSLGGTLASGNVSLGTGAGTGATFSISGVDGNFVLNVTTGTTPAASATIATITYVNSRGHTAVCVALPSSFGAYTQLTQIPSVSTTGSATSTVLQSGTTALVASTSYSYIFSCP